MFSGLVIDMEPAGPAYKVGDKVRVRHDLDDSVIYRDELGKHHCGLVKPMLKHAGKVVTIKEVHRAFGGIFYNICEDGWNWVYDEFEGLAEAPELTFSTQWIIDEEPIEPAPQWTKPAAEQPHTDWTWEDLF